MPGKITLTDAMLSVSATETDAKARATVVTAKIINALYDGNEVVIPNVGTLRVVERAARVGRNIHTGEAVPVPARRTVVLAAATALKKRLNATN